MVGVAMVGVARSTSLVSGNLWCQVLRQDFSFTLIIIFFLSFPFPLPSLFFLPLPLFPISSFLAHLSFFFFFSASEKWSPGVGWGLFPGNLFPLLHIESNALHEQRESFKERFIYSIYPTSKQKIAEEEILVKYCKLFALLNIKSNATASAAQGLEPWVCYANSSQYPFLLPVQSHSGGEGSGKEEFAYRNHLLFPSFLLRSREIGEKKDLKRLL